MLYQIFSLLLEFVVGLLSTACLLRLYMQYRRIAMSARSGNPLGPFVLSLTNWLVLPLRRLLPAIGAFDSASLVAAILLQLVGATLWLLAGSKNVWLAWLLLALFNLLQWALSMFSVAIIVYAVLSWLPTRSLLNEVIGQLVRPLLAPIRRWLPLIGGIDLSPLVALLMLQIATVVLQHLQLLALQAF